MSALSSDLTLGSSTTLGRYFGIVSAIPSLVLALWLYVLLATQPWRGAPNVRLLATTNPVAEPAHGIALILIALVSAVVTHPLQLTATQFLEGYWGRSDLGRAWQHRLTARHLRRRLQAERRVDAAGDAVEDQTDRIPKTADGAVSWKFIRQADAESLIAAHIDASNAQAIVGGYPIEHANTMPTRLGNILRRYETIAGAAVGLSVLSWATHIGMVAKQSHTSYVQDQRNSMDLAVRMTVVSAIAFVVTFGLLWPHGPWLLTALVPLASACLSYQGAVSAGAAYGLALVAWVDLNRFRLYSELHLATIHSAETERTQNAALEDLVLGQVEFNASYGSVPEPAPEDDA